MAQKNEPNEGTIIITDNQTAGKGQRGNTWESAPEENLTFSIIYKPHFLNSSESFNLNIVTSLALIYTLKNFGIPAFIKWPNDIFCGKYKISGILIENTIEKNKLKNSIIGIGLNVNQPKFTYSEATSMYNISNRLYDLSNVLEVLVTNIERLYINLKSGTNISLRDQYHQYLLGKGELRNFQIRDQEVQGRILGVDESGRLKVEIAGKTEYFSFKEIKFLF